MSALKHGTITAYRNHGCREGIRGLRGAGDVLWPAWRWLKGSQSDDVEITVLDERAGSEPTC